MHGRCRLRIGGCITAVAADQGVVAIAAIQNVVPGAAIDAVIAAESEQRVVTARAAEVVRHRGSQERVVIVVSGEERGGGDRAVRELQRLDARHVVHHSESSEAEGLRRGIEGDGVVGAASVQNDGVVARSAVVVVAAAAADQRVVTGAAFEPVVFLVTFQRVIEIGAGKPVNQDIGIARRIAGVVRGMAEAGDDAARRSFVARDVGRIQCVRRSALIPVGEIERAGEVVEVAVPVAVDEVAAIEDVGAGTADQTIVPEAADEHVVADVADQHIAKDGPDQVLDAVIGIAGCNSGVARGIGKIGRDARADGGIKTVKDRVEAIAAHEMIVAERAHEQVVAHAADKGVAAAQSIQNVVAGPADDRVGDTESSR